MTAQPLHTHEQVDFEVYDAPYAPDYDWPALEYPAPLTTPQIVRKPRKQRAPIRVVGMDGVVHPADDDTLADVLAAVIPCRALDPDPQPLVFTTPVLPLDEKPARIEVVKPAITNLEVAKVKGGFAVPYFNQEPLVVPMGQRKLVPTSCWYRAMTNAQDTDGDTFWYRFEVMPGVIVGYSEQILKKLNGVGE